MITIILGVVTFIFIRSLLYVEVKISNLLLSSHINNYLCEYNVIIAKKNNGQNYENKIIVVVINHNYALKLHENTNVKEYKVRMDG